MRLLLAPRLHRSIAVGPAEAILRSSGMLHYRGSGCRRSSNPQSFGVLLQTGVKDPLGFPSPSQILSCSQPGRSLLEMHHLLFSSDYYSYLII